MIVTDLNILTAASTIDRTRESLIGLQRQADLLALVRTDDPVRRRRVARDLRSTRNARARAERAFDAAVASAPVARAV